METPRTFADEIIRGIDAEQEIIRELAAKQVHIYELAGKQRELEEENAAVETPEPEPVPEPEPELASQDETEVYTVYDPRRDTQATLGEPVDGVVITLLDDQDFFSGEARILSVLITERRGEKEKVLSNIPVSIKILGTAFRPLIYSVKTQRDGVATVSTEIPNFTTGRAAVLVRVAAKDSSAELRRVIHPTIDRAI